MSGFKQHLTPEITTLIYDAHAWIQTYDTPAIKILLTDILTRFQNPQTFTVENIPLLERDIAYTFCLKNVKRKEFYLSRIAHLNSPNLATMRTLAPFVTEDPDAFEAELIKRMATQYHDILACYEYGTKLMDQGSIEEGLSFLEISATEKFWRAQLAVGQYYYTKSGRSEADLDKAIFMLNLVHNNPQRPVRTIGLLDLGIIYYESAELEGNEADFKKAFHYFTEIEGDGGFKEVKLFLSICHFFGQGTEKNASKAMTILNDWLKEVRQEDLVQETPFKTPIGFVMAGYAQLAAYLAQPEMPYSNIEKALEYVQYLNHPSRRQMLPVKLMTIEIIYEKLITPYLKRPVDIRKPETVNRFKFALQMFRPVFETLAMQELSPEKALATLDMLDLVFTLSENEIIYYYPKYITMLHDLMIKLSKSLSEISRRYKIRQPTREEIAESYQLAMPSKPKKKEAQPQKPKAEAETVELSPVTDIPEPAKQVPDVQAIPKVKKEPAVKIKTRIQDTQRVIQDLTKQLKEEEARIEKFYMEKASNPIKKIYNEIMTKGKVTKEDLQKFVRFLKDTKEATSRQMSKSGGIERVTLGDYTIGAHAPHKGETHLDKGALADIRKTLIAFYKDQVKE